MIVSDKDIILFDQYLDHQLSLDDKKSFEARLQTDHDFQRAFNEHQDIRLFIQQKGNSDTKKLMQSWESNSTKNQNSTSNNNIKYGIALILILLLSGLFYTLTSQSKKLDNQALFAAHFNPYPNELAILERGDVNNSPLQKAMISYQNGNYPVAIERFDEILKQDADVQLIFYKAIALLAIDQDQQALDILIPLDQLSDFKFKEAVRWNLALAHIKTDDKPKAQNMLQRILDSGQTYQKTSASKLLKKLKSHQ